jgi:peptidyl-prolyl cis-trans isomerase A (cyclophilin A)
MTHHDRSWTITLRCFAASLLLTPCCFAQHPAISRFEGRYAISVEGCLDQASRAFELGGFSVAHVVDPQRYHVVYAYHGTVMAALACNEAPGGMTWVNIFVASSPGDNAVTTREAQSLLDRMERLCAGAMAPQQEVAVTLAEAPAPAKSAEAQSATAAAPAPSLMNPSTLRAKAPDLYRVKFTTTHGDFAVEVHRAWAPLGADRFYNLVVNNFFTDAAFFRYVPRFIVQFGLPANPAVAGVWQNANIQDDPVKQSNHRGTLVFATAGPSTRTTQLFINVNDNGALDGQGFAPFGTVTEGMNVVDGFYSGYGESPDQGRIRAEGKAYLDQSFPKLDSIKSATITWEIAPRTEGAQNSVDGSLALGSVYVSAQNAGDRLQLNASDGSFSLQESGQKFSGTYTVNGNVLKLHVVQLGKDVDIAIDGRKLIVNGEEIWVQPSR